MFYPEVGKRLNVQTHIPDHSDVANAVGAALGIIRAEYSIEITQYDKGGYLIHSGAKPEHQEDASKALALAQDLAERKVRSDLEAKGGQAHRVSMHIERIQIPDVDDDSGLVSARVTASCDSLPE